EPAFRIVISRARTKGGPPGRRRLPRPKAILETNQARRAEYAHRERGVAATDQLQDPIGPICIGGQRKRIDPFITLSPDHTVPAPPNVTIRLVEYATGG